MMEVTKAMLEDPRIVEYGVVRLSSGAAKYQLKEELKKLYGGDCHIHAATYEVYLANCVRLIDEMAMVDVKKVANRLQTFLWSMMADLSNAPRDRIHAARELRRVFGITANESGAEEQATEIQSFLHATRKLQPERPQ